MNSRTPTIATTVLIGLAALTPWANGGADPVVQVPLFALAGLAAALAFARRDPSTAPRILPWPAIASLGGILLCGFHLIPIWPTTAGASVPAAVALRVELTQPPSDESSAPAAAPSKQVASDRPTQTSRPVALTLDGHATRHTLALLWMSTAVFVAAVWLIDSPTRLTQAAWAVAASGAALTLFAVLAKATWNGKLYWSIPVGHPQGVFGPMVYHNQAGGILLLTLAAAIYLLVLAGRDALPRVTPTTASTALRISPPLWRRWLQPRPLLAILLVTLNGSGLLLTLSRGALVAGLVAGVLTLLVIQPRSGWRGLAMVAAIAVVGVGGTVFFFRMSDAVGRRYATLFESEPLLHNSRLAHWHDGWQAGTDHWLLGVGAGAYLHAHPLYQQQPVERTFLRAHNQYLETWVDSGLPGIVLLALAIATSWTFVPALARRQRTTLRATAALGCMVLVATAVHAGVDYVLYLPATSLLFGLLLGGVCGTAWQTEWETRPDRGRSQRRFPRVSRWGVCLPPRTSGAVTVALVSGCLWATFAGIRWHEEDVAIQSVPWGEDQVAVDPQRLDRAIARLDGFLETTDDYRVALSLAELRIIQFRQRGAEQLASENGLLPSEAGELWQWTAPMVLLQRAHQLREGGEAERIETEIRSEPLVAQSLGAARQALLRARHLAPAAPQPHLRLGELSFLEASHANAATHLHRVARLAPGSGDMQYELGRRLLAVGEPMAGLAAWRRSLELDTRHWPAIYSVVGQQLTPTEIDRWVLPDDPELLTLVAARQYTEPEQREAREALLKRADAILQQPVEAPEQRARNRRLQAEVQLLREDVEGAIERFAEALQYQPADHEMRARRAALLLTAGRLDEAQREAQYAARLQPRNHQYRKLLEAIGEASN